MHRLVTLAALLAVALPIGAPANTLSWEDLSKQTGLAALDSAPLVQTPPQIAFLRAPAQPDVTTPPYLINFVAVGPSESGTPCFNCVSGAGSTFNIGITGPYNYIQTKEQAQFAISFTNLSNTKNCTLSIAITSGSATIDKFSYILKTPSAYGSYVIGFNRNRPSYSGAAVLTGKIDCAGKGAQTSTSALIYQ